MMRVLLKSYAITCFTLISHNALSLTSVRLSRGILCLLYMRWNQINAECNSLMQSEWMINYMKFNNEKTILNCKKNFLFQKLHLDNLVYKWNLKIMKNDDAVGRKENSIIKPNIGLWFGHKVPRSLGCSSSRLVAGSL